MATEKASFTIDNEVIKKIKELAKKEKRSVSQMISILLDEALISRGK